MTGSHVGPIRRPVSKGPLGQQHSERGYYPQGIGAQISGQNFYKVAGDTESNAPTEKNDGPFKKLKINAEYL